MNRPWISLYIYYHQDPTPLLVECLEPLVRELQNQRTLRQHFYVRYWEGGPHVRFRVLPQRASEADGLRDHLIQSINAYLQKYPSLVQLDVERYAQASAYFSSFELGEVKSFELHPNNTVRQVAYVPEWQSYGGQHAMPAVERQFSVSSSLGLQLLGQPTSAERRVGRAMYMMLSGLQEFAEQPAELQHWFTLYNQSWMPALQPNPAAFIEIFGQRFERQREHLTKFVGGVLERHRFGEQRDSAQSGSAQPPDRLMEDWINSFYHLRQRLERLGQEHKLEYDSKPLLIQDSAIIALNCLHMHNNRIGISLHEEAYLTFLLKEALGAWIASRLAHGGHSVMPNRLGAAQQPSV